jgi:magnesium-transporting ATPase (P-type)
LRISGKIFPPLFSLFAPVQILWLRLAALGLCAFALDSSSGSRMGRKATVEVSTAAEASIQPSILQYPISLVCFLVPLLQACRFSANSVHFRKIKDNQPKFHSMNYLCTK